MEILMDNVSAYHAAVAWLEQKYRIKGIEISTYNSRANRKIEWLHLEVFVIVIFENIKSEYRKWIDSQKN